MIAARVRLLNNQTTRECVVAEFSQSKSTLYRVLDAALIERNLIGIKDSQLGKIPEAQLLPLKKLEPEEQREAWSITTQFTSNPTAEQVSQVVENQQNVCPIGHNSILCSPKSMNLSLIRKPKDPTAQDPQNEGSVSPMGEIRESVLRPAVALSL
jgi:hypothetical protein